jgi:IS1 family transposase/transposase-like protein
MTDTDFEEFRASQFCDNSSCDLYQIVGGNNLRIKSRKCCQLYCNKCGNNFSVRRGTMFFQLRTPLDTIISCLSLLASGLGVNAVVREKGVSAESLRDWIRLASEQVDAFSKYMQRDMNLGQVQIDEFWSFIRKKKENLTAEDILAGSESSEVADNQGDRWTFVAVLPESGFVHTVHTGHRTQEEAIIFVEKIKSNSDKKAPFFMSDCWFYGAVLAMLYSFFVAVEYCGRGRRPAPKRVVDPALRYAQVYKQRNSKGKIESISTRILLGDEVAMLNELLDAKRSKTINTDFVESRNGKYRKDNARLIRRTLCHSKDAKCHDASIIWLTQVFNYTRFVVGLRVEINPNAKKFEKKYQQRTPAMAEGLIDKHLTIRQLLFIRPIKIAT